MAIIVARSNHIQQLEQRRIELEKLNTQLAKPIQECNSKAEEIALALQGMWESLDASVLSIEEIEAFNGPIIAAVNELRDRADEMYAKGMNWKLIPSRIIKEGVYIYTSIKVKSLRDEAEKLEQKTKDTATMQSKINDLISKIKDFQKQSHALRSSIPADELDRASETIIDLILNKQAISISKEMEICAQNAGTTMDRMLERYGQAVTPFANGQITRDFLDASIQWARAERGKYDVSPEQLAFRQFINQVVIAHQDYFEILASKYDDLQKTGRKGQPALEILKKKPVSLSGRRIKMPTPPATEEDRLQATASIIAQDKLGVLEFGNILDQPGSVKERLASAMTATKEHLKEINKIFGGINKEIQVLIEKATDQKNEADARKVQLERDHVRNMMLDARIEDQEFDTYLQTASYEAENSNFFRTLRVVSGAGLLVSSTAGGAGLAGTVGAIAMGGTSLVGQVSKAVAGRKIYEVEAAIKREFILDLRSQKVDVEKHKGEIDTLFSQIKELGKSQQVQELMKDAVKYERVVNAYLCRSLLIDGYHNVRAMEQSCEQAGIESVDTFLSSFEGRLRQALQRFCFGIANSNDMKVILAESNAIHSDTAKAHERALKGFVEDVMKPDIAAYLTHASKIDKMMQTNLTGYGTPLHWEREMVRDETDRAWAALIANEFGMSVVGLQDVRNLFDSYLHRHGDRYLYDAKLKDGQMTDTYPDNRVSVVSEDTIERFVDNVKYSMAHGRNSQPDVGDMFLRVCGYEYFMPQAVRTAGIDNIFSENSAAPAAYPMVNRTINSFIEKLSLSPIDEKYHREVKDVVDNLIAQTFITFFGRLGEIHNQDPKIAGHRDMLKMISREKYGPEFSAYMRRITADAVNHFDLFLDIYKQNLERTLELVPEARAAALQQQLQLISEPARTMLTPDVVKPGSHTSILRARYEDNSFENMLRRDGGRA